MFKNKNESNIVYKCTIRLLNDSDVIECEFQPFHKGSYLVEYMCNQLKIKEKDYFGLRYVDAGKQRHWLDLAKSIIKQCKDVNPILFSFRVKFYPVDPFRLTGNGRLMLYQQLKRDLRHGRLYCSQGEAAALGALIVQEELGDYNEDIHVGDYVSLIPIVLRQTPALEKKIIELHKKRQPYQDKSVAIDEFMSIARGLDTYGIEPHFVKDHCGSQLYVGINHSGISTYVMGKRSQHFRWNEVHKLNFEGKMFIAHLSYTDASREPKKHTIGFKCSSVPACRYLWRCAIEQMLFFTLPNNHNTSIIYGGGFFSWGTKFKYTGRTEREILTESINALREQKLSGSAASKRKASSVPATPSSPQGDLTKMRYSSLPRSTISDPLSNCTGVIMDSAGNIIYGNHPYESGAMSNLEPVSEEARLRTSDIKGLNSIVGGMSSGHYHDPIEHGSNEDTAYVDGLDGCVYQHGSGKHLHFMSNKQYALPSSSINLKASIGNSNSNTPHSESKAGSLAMNAIGGGGAAGGGGNMKSVRKFHLLHAFIPSLILVVFVMILSAIFILESESQLFERIRNMPEMICLRYQYYQPLKKFFLHKFQQKS